MDRLTIVSHDHFQEIIDEANKPDSIIRTGIVIGRDIPDRDLKVIEVAPVIVGKVAGDASLPEQKPLFNTEREKAVAKATLEVIKQFERLPTSSGLKSPDTLKKLVERVQLSVAPAQGELAGVTEQVNGEDC